MKKYMIVAMILLIALVACSPAAEEMTETPTGGEEPTAGRQPPARPLPSERVTTPEEPTAPSAPSEPVSAPAPEPVAAPTAPSTSLDPELRDLLKRADEKISSMSFLYGGTETGNLFLDTFDIMGTKMVIHKFSEDYYVREGYYDTVYVDTAAKTAVGCCEEQARCKSHNIDNTGKKFDVDYSSLKIPKTPYQWTKEVKSGSVVGPQTFASRSVTYIKYTTPDGTNVDMWIDDTYGVPHKVVTEKGGVETRYQFNDVVFNSLKESAFTPTCV